MNGDETGVDCGGSCAPCPEVIVVVPIKLNVMADAINAEILDTYRLKITVENIGQAEATNLVIVANKWTRENATIKSILPATSEQGDLLLSLPPDYNENSIEIQVVQNDILVSSKTVPVQLQVPPFNVKLGWDAETGKVYKAVVVDNREKNERNLKVDYTVYKGKETYILDTGSSYAVPANQVFHSIDYLFQTIPSGQYVVNSTFYEAGEPVGQATSVVILGGDRKGFNVQFLFYLLLVGIVGVCGYVFFLSQRKEKGENEI